MTLNDLNSTGLGLPMYLSIILNDKTDKSSTCDKSEILRILTLTSVTLVKVKSHMTLLRYCGIDTSVILSHNTLDIYLHLLSAGTNAEYAFFVTFDLEMH